VSSLPWFGWFTVNELLKLKSNGSQGWHNHRISFVYLKAPRLLPLREIMKCTSKKRGGPQRMARGGKHKTGRWPCHPKRHDPQRMMQETKNPKKRNPLMATK
jgi:hypothetical protein